MKKLYLAICGLLALAGSLNAATSYKSLELSRHDGSKVVVTIENNMEVSLADGDIHMSSDKGNFSIPVSEVNSMGFTQTAGDDNLWSALDLTDADANKVMVIRRGGQLTLRGVAQNDRVALTALDGRTVAAGTATQGQDYVIDVDGLATGVYVLTYGNYSLKIALR